MFQAFQIFSDVYISYSAVLTEAPEEVVETRSLYEQLQAQKDAKQLEYEEQHRMSEYLFTLLLLPLHSC